MMLATRKAWLYLIAVCLVSQGGRPRFLHVRKMVLRFASIYKATSGNQASGTPCSKTLSVTNQSFIFGTISAP